MVIVTVLRSVFSTSGIATILMIFYLYATCKNLHKLMYPLAGLDGNARHDAASSLVRPLWRQGEPMFLRVYLSVHPDVAASPESFFGDSGDSDDVDDDENEDDDANGGSTGEKKARTTRRTQQQEEHEVDTVLLWDEKVNSPSFRRSFLLTTCPDNVENNKCRDGNSYRSAVSRLDDADKLERRLRGEENDGIASVLTAAGHGIESTSLLLTLYQSAYRNVRAMFGTAGHDEGTPRSDDVGSREEERRRVVYLSSESPLWQSLVGSSTRRRRANSTSASTSSSMSLHVLLIRAAAVPPQHRASWPPATPEELRIAVAGAAQTHGLLGGKVDLVKFDPPTHLRKPSRILYHDLVYLWRRLLRRRRGKNQDDDYEYPPWDMEHVSPQHYRDYVKQKSMKLRGEGYPYWKPEVSVKYVTDHVDYPLNYVHLSGMPIVRVPKSERHPTGYSYTPAIHVDEIGLTSEKYVPVNETLTSLPLILSFDRSDVAMDSATGTSAAGTGSTGTSGGISPARWRLLSHLSQALESQKALGFDESDIDDLRRLIADTNVTLLLVTLLASVLHMLFEFLTFKNEVSFWRHNRDLTGLSVRALFLDGAGQFVILLYLVEQDSSLLVTIPSAIGCLIALWKCHRAAGFQLVKVSASTSPGARPPASWWNALLRRAGYELRATRLEEAAGKGTAGDANGGAATSSSSPSAASERDRLSALTLESDRIATRTLGAVLLPVVLSYAAYQWMYVPHVGWYSWLVTSSSSAVYALGFVLMTPQLFLNWKLKSVAHLPWRVLVYKSLNTFIDDLFSFIIRMPTMARISCFRDDVVFFIYLYQRWLYPVDASRPVEGGVGERKVDEDRDANSKEKASKGGKKETKKDR